MASSCESDGPSCEDVFLNELETRWFVSLGLSCEAWAPGFAELSPWVTFCLIGRSILNSPHLLPSLQPTCFVSTSRRASWGT